MNQRVSSSNSYIDARSDSPGLAEARIVTTDIPVWAIIGYLEATGWDVQRTAQDYGTSVEAVSAAISFYEEHREVIDARIAANVIHVD